MANDPNSLLTAGKKVRYLGTARSGTAAARGMHLTSVALIPLSIAFVWLLATLVHKDYAAAHEALARPCPAIIMLLFVSASVWHMKIGMQAIIDDYVHTHHLKQAALIANAFFSAVIGFACVYSILKISFAH